VKDSGSCSQMALSCKSPFVEFETCYAGIYMYSNATVISTTSFLGTVAREKERGCHQYLSRSVVLRQLTCVTWTVTILLLLLKLSLLQEMIHGRV